MVFMVPTDEHDFGARLVEDLGHQATWSAVCTARSGSVMTSHSSSPRWMLPPDAARPISSSPARTATPVGPILEYTASAFRWQDGREPLIAGRLAYQWFPGEESPEVAQRFDALVRTAWRQLNVCSLPHVAYLDGTPIPNARIGRHAKRWLLADQARLLGDSGARWFVFGLRPGR